MMQKCFAESSMAAQRADKMSFDGGGATLRMRRGRSAIFQLMVE